MNITLSKCNLRNVDFRGALMQGADFGDSDLKGAKFDDTSAQNDARKVSNDHRVAEDQDANRSNSN